MEVLGISKVSLAQAVDREVRTRYGVLADDDPAVVWIREFAKETFGVEYEIHILKDHTQPDAMASMSNTIYISKPMLGRLEFEEELEFLLGHEIRHANERHIDKQNETGRIGTGRLAEMRADLGSLTSSPRALMGGLSFFRKFQGGGWDAAHGRSVDRLLNSMWSTRLFDYGDIETTLTPISNEVGFSELGHPGRVERIVNMAQEPGVRWDVEQADFWESLYALKDLRGRKENLGDIKERLAKKVYRGLPRKNKGVLLQVLGPLVGSVFEDTLGDQIENSWDGLTPEMFLESLQTGLSMVPTNYSETFGNYIAIVATHLLEEDCFDTKNPGEYLDFANQVAKVLDDGFQEKLQGAQRQVLYQHFFEAGLLDYLPGEEMDLYISTFSEALPRLGVDSILRKAGFITDEDPFRFVYADTPVDHGEKDVFDFRAEKLMEELQNRGYEFSDIKNEFRRISLGLRLGGFDFFLGVASRYISFHLDFHALEQEIVKKMGTTDDSAFLHPRIWPSILRQERSWNYFVRGEDYSIAEMGDEVVQGLSFEWLEEFYESLFDDEVIRKESPGMFGEPGRVPMAEGIFQDARASLLDEKASKAISKDELKKLVDKATHMDSRFKIGGSSASRYSLVEHALTLDLSWEEDANFCLIYLCIFQPLPMPGCCKRQVLVKFFPAPLKKEWRY